MLSTLKWNIAVGPVWRGGTSGEAELLCACYRNCLDAASQEKLGGVAFPAISCGVYGYPHEAATRIALTTVMQWLEENDAPLQVIFVLFDAPMANVYRRVFQEIQKS